MLYSGVPLYRGPKLNTISYSTVVTEVEYN